MSTDPRLIRDLAAQVGAPQVLGRPADLAAYGFDAFGASGERHLPDAVVFPGSTAEVAAVVQVCADHGVAAVPRGAGTGYSGGAVPKGGGVVVSLCRMARFLGMEPEAMRLHICWGNYEGPHTHDIPLAKVLPACMRARPQALLFEAANPRHAHEWEDLKSAKIPDDKILMPGLIDSTTNFVEHPRLVAQRLQHYADIVGRERVIAGTDCGFATFAAQQNPVVPSIVWAKLAALAEGARVASERLWRRAGAA